MILVRCLANARRLNCSLKKKLGPREVPVKALAVERSTEGRARQSLGGMARSKAQNCWRIKPKRHQATWETCSSTRNNDTRANLALPNYLYIIIRLFCLPSVKLFVKDFPRENKNQKLRSRVPKKNRNTWAK